MKIHEYQAREIFSSHGIPVPEGDTAVTADEAAEIAARIDGPVVIKAQVHVGGRGKAGGVKLADNPEEAREKASAILGMDLKGLTVKKVLVSRAVDIVSESYVGIVVDRKSKKPVLMVSPAGGVEIEQVAKETPEQIFKVVIEPAFGLMPNQARQLAFKLFDEKSKAFQAADIISRLYDAFVANDCSLAEINPLIEDDKGRIWAIDAKINLDDSGLGRHPELEALRDMDEEVVSEVDARKAGLSYVKLDGDVGCIVNGAGLAMATMDLIKLRGGEPANFLDIGGSSNPEKVLNAMRIILKDPNVKVILFNIFGGITRCDDVARGIGQALEEIDCGVPIVIRLAGTNSEEAKVILQDLKLESASSMDDGVRKAIEMAAV